MESILKNEIRNGNFTSSEIVALTKMGSRKMTKDEIAALKLIDPKSRKTTVEDGFGKAGLTYILEKRFERNLGRSLDDEKSAKPLKWGKLLEKRVGNILPYEYELQSNITVVHPTIDCWAGSKDVLIQRAKKTIGEIKCPMTLKSFCLLVQALYDGLVGMDAINMIRETHPDGEKFYWQMVSNAILDGVNSAELIVYMPYESELDEIKMMVHDLPIEMLEEYYFVTMAKDGELPFLKDGGYYKNLNIIPFEIPDADIEFLTNRVIEASTLLSPPLQIAINTKN